VLTIFADASNVTACPGSEQPADWPPISGGLGVSVGFGSIAEARGRGPHPNAITALHAHIMNIHRRRALETRAPEPVDAKDYCRSACSLRLHHCSWDQEFRWINGLVLIRFALARAYAQAGGPGRRRNGGGVHAQPALHSRRFGMCHAIRVV